MSQNGQTQVCSICGENYIKPTQSTRNYVIRVECDRCGKYDIGFRLFSVKFSEQPWRDVRHYISAWIRRENYAGLVPYIGSEDESEPIYEPNWWVSRFTHMGFPEMTGEKIDALLLAYAKSIGGNYGKQFSFGEPHFIADIAAKDQEEVDGLNKLLGELGLIDNNPKITAKGWLRLDELRKMPARSDLAFVAMWFNDVTASYRKAVIAAIEYCGFKPAIIDQQEYNDFVMNQVIASIKQSRFLVADFTSRPEIEKDGIVKNGVRGGVYWEAGMAYGLGVPVIHTSEDNAESKSRIHFDVNQYNTIFWKTDELGIEIRSLDQTRTNPNFAEKLAARILSTIGRGTYSPASR